MRMKKLFLVITLVLGFLMAQTASVSAPSHPEVIIADSIEIQLDKEFQIYASQSAILNSESVTIKVISIDINECEIELGITTDIECAAFVSTAKITITKDLGDVSEGTEVNLTAFESYSVFGLKISNKGLFSGNDSLAEPDYAKFIISATEETIPEPIPIKVGLNQRFELKQSQLALIQKNGITIVKMALNGFIKTDAGIYSSLSLSVANGGQGDIKLLAGEKTQFGNYIIYFHEYDARSNLGVFSVSETAGKPDPIYVELDRKFELLLQQNAIIRGESLQVFLSGIVETISACPEGKEDCEVVEGERQVILDVSFIKASFASETVATTNSIIGITAEADSALNTVTAVIEQPIFTGTGTTVFLGEGDSKEVFGFKITAADIGSNSAILLIEKPVTTPPTAIVELNQKFKLENNQRVTVVRTSGNTQQQIMDLTLNGFIFSACAYEEKIGYTSTGGMNYICNTRVIAELTASSPPRNGVIEVTVLRIKEGEEGTFNGYNVEFAYYDSGVGVFVVREGIVDDLIRVGLGQKFDLKPSQTALVVDEGLYITLDGIQIAESFPLQKWVVISVWKGIVFEKESSLIAQYKMKEGQELELHGVKIQVIGILDSGKSATFAVTKEDTSVINVHVNEKFSLKENQGAKVLEANMKIDLHRISTEIICYTDNFGRTDSPEERIVERPCIESKSVQISVDSYVFGRTSPGIAVDSVTIVNEVISNYVDSATGSVSSNTGKIVETQNTIEVIEQPVPIPPTPFEIYNLSEGESIEINDFEITVLYIGSSYADFIVKEKSTGITYTYAIQKGWNLFSMPGKIEAENNNCNSSEWTLYEYNKETNSFVKIREPTPGKAYWLYNPSSSCEAKVSIRKALELSDLDKLTKGWNFVAVVPEMIGRNINDLGSCDLKAAFRFNAVSNNWESIINLRITNNDLGTGFVLYSNNDCSLAGETAIPAIPSLPELPTVD